MRASAGLVAGRLTKSVRSSGGMAPRRVILQTANSDRVSATTVV
jgi:hypothetical protein